MAWQIYTKLVRLDAATVGLRWFWRDPNGLESPGSFTTRSACEADAVRLGHTPTGEDHEAIDAHWKVASPHA